MRRAKPQPVRNKIDLSDRAQIRAWTRRLGIKPDDLNRIIGKVGNSIAAVSKEVDLQKAPEPLRPVVAEVQLTATGG